MSKRRSLVFLLMAMLTGELIALPGCHSINGTSDEFKTFTLEEGFSHFSFEYPADYDEPYYGAASGKEWLPTSASVSRPHPDAYRPEILIHISVDRVDEYTLNAKSQLERAYSIYSSFPDFTLLDRSSLLVGTYPAEQIVYSDTMYEIEDGKPVPKINRFICLDHGDYIYTISLSADKYIIETAQADFKHLLETFQILQEAPAPSINDDINNKKYLMYSRNLGVFNVTFQYPVAFKHEYTYYRNQHIGLDYIRSSLDGKTSGWLAIEGFHTDIADLLQTGYPDVETAIDFMISELGRLYKEDKIEILEQSSVIINGFVGKKLICSYQQISPYFPYITGYPDTDESPVFIDRYVFFQIGDFIWKVSFVSQKETAKEDNAYFDYLIKTLRIVK